jgi:uncharacterized protein
MDPNFTTCTAFDATAQIAAGSRADVAIAVKSLLARSPNAQVLIFDDATGRDIDFDLRGSDAEIAARLGTPAGPDPARGPGRPKLGVVPREVTLLPRHWQWLATQPGGASVTLRKLVEEARRANAGKDETRAAQTRAYSFMSAMAGNFGGFEEAARALFSGDRAQFSVLIANWPQDVRAYADRLAFGGGSP